MVEGVVRSEKISYRIDAPATFEYIWDQMILLQTQENVKRILKEAIENKFYGINLDRIRKERKKLKKTKKGMPKKFINECNIETAASRVVTFMRQAYEYYRSAREAGFLTKPVLLYYGMVSLSKALIDSTYIISKPVKSHGLRIVYDDGKPLLRVEVERNGEFQTFRDTYISDTTLYTFKENKLSFDLKELLSVIPGIANEWRITYQGRANPKEFRTTGILAAHKKELNDITAKYTFKLYRNKQDLKELQEKFNVHVIDAHFLAMYILCTLARYYPQRWQKIIENSKEAFLIKAFLTRSERDFPILIYSEITGMETHFLPFPRMVG